MRAHLLGNAPLSQAAPVAGRRAASTLPTGLVAYWKLDEASGSRADSVGSNTLTDNNTVTQNPGKVGSAAQCTAGNNEYLSIADNAALSTGDIDVTFGGWFYPTTIDAGENTILSKSATNEIEYLVEIYSLSGNNHFRFGVSSNGTGITGDLDQIEMGLVTATWHHFLAWHNGTANTLNYQLNGGTIRSLSYSAGIRDGVGPVNIGRLGVVAGRYFNGRLDDMKMWKRVLTIAERAEDYNNGLAGRALL